VPPAASAVHQRVGCLDGELGMNKLAMSHSENQSPGEAGASATSYFATCAFVLARAIDLPEPDAGSNMVVVGIIIARRCKVIEILCLWGRRSSGTTGSG